MNRRPWSAPGSAGVEPREERALCEAAEEPLRKMLHAAVAGGADPANVTGRVRDLGGGRLEVGAEPKDELLRALDAWGAGGTSRIAAAIRAASGPGFPVLVVARAGVYVMSVQFFPIARNRGDA